MDIKDSMRRLDVTLYGNVETLTPTLSKCRVRIFYKGLNRNRTFISDDFAQQLIDSLPYAPVKGIFNKDAVDYEDHGENNTDGRIYGVISADPNFAWETHLDEDDVEREYACADVILYTALYPEANLISGKSQSMEIHRAGLTGEWKIWDGDKQPYYQFHKGHLLGLQVLGDEVEPCFEGSAFFSLYKDAKELYDYVKKSNEKEESRKMDKNLFRLSDSAKCDLLWNALNADPESCTMICEIYDDYALAFDCVNRKYLRAYYTKDNATDSVTINSTEDCFIVDVNTAEMAAIEALKAIGTYSEIQSKIESSDAEIARINSEHDTFCAELQNQIASLQAELEEFKKDEKKDDDESDDKKEEEDASDDDKKDDDADDKKKDKNSLEKSGETEGPSAEDLINSYKTQLEEKDAEIARLSQLNSDIINEKSELESFKAAVDTEKKTAILEEFSAHLTETQINDFTAKMADFSVEDFEKEVCVTAYKSDRGSFGKKEEPKDELLWTGDDNKNFETGALKLLSKHKGGNK